MLWVLHCPNLQVMEKGQTWVHSSLGFDSQGVQWREKTLECPVGLLFGQWS
jgi:hypothetical protein